MYTPPPKKPSARARRPLTAADRAQVLAALRTGGTVTSVAAVFGLDRATVRRLRDTAGTPERGQTGSVVVTTRLAVAEARAFDGRIAALGFRSRSEGLRAAVRVASGLLEFPGTEGARLEALAAALNKIGVNINQLARLANSGRLAAGAQQIEVLSELRRELAQLRAFMTMLNTERRRRGLRLFETFVQAERSHG